RGKLLNIGFVLAKREGFNSFIFHDVDLLPTDAIRQWYVQTPRKGSVAHIARCWNRYSGRTYLGGIVGFCREDFEALDGFPNTYWGWGGEDDELSARVREHKLNVIGPDRKLDKAITDLEEMSLSQKLEWLKANREIKCEVKWEVNAEHNKHR